MKKILFLRGKNAYLPEIAAYRDYLGKRYPDVQVFDSEELDDYSLNDFDIIWRFMGTDTKGAGRFRVHEYNSLSAPPFPHLKNRVKKLVNRLPDRRVFLNEGVRQDFGFNDSLPFALRDMGVAQKFFEQGLGPEYDFVYAGSVHRGAEVLRAIEHFAANPAAGTFLVIGSVAPEILEHYKQCNNIIFTGPVPYEEVPALIASGRYGLNLIPDRYPFNRQTATKVIEYCALGLPVVSMRYGWIEDFMGSHGGTAFWLDPDFKNLRIEEVEKFEFKIPSVRDFEWSKIIEQSGIFDFLKQV